MVGILSLSVKVAFSILNSILDWFYIPNTLYAIVMLLEKENVWYKYRLQLTCMIVRDRLKLTPFVALCILTIKFTSKVAAFISDMFCHIVIWYSNNVFFSLMTAVVHKLDKLVKWAIFFFPLRGREEYLDSFIFIFPSNIFNGTTKISMNYSTFCCKEYVYESQS